MRPVFLIAGCCLLSGCLFRGGGGASVPEAPVAPEALLESARAEFRRGDFQKALNSFQRATFELPINHPGRAEAQYFLAESHFQRAERDQAAAEFRKVSDQFPNSPYAPLALLRAGDSHLRRWRKPELDPTPGMDALAIYQELAGRYPGTEAAARAQLHVRRLREWFADKAYRNGTFYLSRKAYDSAIIYFKEVVASYPEAPRAADALLRLVETYRSLRYEEELQETCSHLRRFYAQTEGLSRYCPAAQPESN
jgi:outer membrane protein assembly factor BamD